MTTIQVNSKPVDTSTLIEITVHFGEDMDKTVVFTPFMTITSKWADGFIVDQEEVAVENDMASIAHTFLVMAKSGQHDITMIEANDEDFNGFEWNQLANDTITIK